MRDAWYAEFKPSKKLKGRISCGHVPAGIEDYLDFIGNIDEFVDQPVLDDNND